MIQRVFTQDFPGGTSVPILLERGYMNLQLEFIGRNSGTITITSKGAGGDVFADIDGNHINLNTHRTFMILNTELDAVNLSDAGTGAYSVRVKQYSN